MNLKAYSSTRRGAKKATTLASAMRENVNRTYLTNAKGHPYISYYFD
jgi:hypothetical protein